MSSALTVAKPKHQSSATPVQRDVACETCADGEPQQVGVPRWLQPKLEVNWSGDAHEREADRVADQVMRQPAHADVSPAPPRIQRLSESSTGAANAAPDSVGHVLASPGRSLESGLRQDMEERFGRDFSGVRVHLGAAAEQSARDVNANAYTVGDDVVFGEGRFAPGTFEGRRLIAHELTHVVQQSSADGLTVGESHDKRRGSAAPTRATPSNVLQAQPAEPKKKADWEPEVEAETRSAHVDVGKTVSLKFHVSNERTAPKGTTFDWRGILLDESEAAKDWRSMRPAESEAVTMVGFSDHVGAHATLVVKGQAPGIAEVGTTVYFKMPGAQGDYKDTPRVRVEVGSAIKAAEAELARIEKLRGKGKEISPSRESAAQQEATVAAQKALGKAHGAAGSEIDQILRNVSLDIAKIENARYRGYQAALTHLNLTQFDEKEQAGNVKSFALSLAGNLIWALSGLIAIIPVGREATIFLGLLSQFGEKTAKSVAAVAVQVQAINRARLATAVGAGGAMLAQFANGLPSGGTKGGGNVSTPLIQLEGALNTLNSGAMNAMSRSVYPTLLRLLDEAPPDRDVDAQDYAGALENAIRGLLFSGYYENGGATDNQINADVIQSNARNQLLRRLIVTSGKISGEGITSTKLDEHGLGKLVGPALALVGGAKAQELGDYELVVEQLQRAARELGLEGLPNVSSDQLREDFAESDKIVLSANWQVTSYGVPVVFEGVPATSPWLWLAAGDIVKLEPHMSGLESFVGGEFGDVLSFQIRKKDLTSAKIGKDGAVVYSAVRFWIRVRGNKGYEGMPEIHHAPMPDMVWLIYNV